MQTALPFKKPNYESLPDFWGDASPQSNDHLPVRYAVIPAHLFSKSSVFSYPDLSFRIFREYQRPDDKFSLKTHLLLQYRTENRSEGG